MLNLNYRDSRPLYGQIKDGLKKMIVSGALGPDEKLPSVRAMAAQLAINPNTIQRAYSELEAEGYLYSLPGKGSFAADRGQPPPGRREDLFAKLREILAELRYLGVGEEDIIAVVKEGFPQ